MGADCVDDLQGRAGRQRIYNLMPSLQSSLKRAHEQRERRNRDVTEEGHGPTRTTQRQGQVTTKIMKKGTRSKGYHGHAEIKDKDADDETKEMKERRVEGYSGSTITPGGKNRTSDLSPSILSRIVLNVESLKPLSNRAFSSFSYLELSRSGPK